MNTHEVHYGASLTPMGFQLRQRNTAGILTNVNLTGLAVKVMIVDAAGNIEVAETTTGVTVTDAATGKCSYDFPSGADALAEGTYYLYARVYSGTEYDMYPTVEKQMKIKVYQHIEESSS